MTDEEMTAPEPLRPHQRVGDADIAGHVRAADVGVGYLVRWLTPVVAVIGFSITIGMQITKYDGFAAGIAAVDHKIDAVQADVRRFMETVNDIRTEVQLLKERDAARAKEMEGLRTEVRDLRAQVDLSRSMREAYVYDAAKQQRRNREVPLAP